MSFHYSTLPLQTLNPEKRDSSSEVKGFKSEASNDQMVKMVSDLQDDDLHDQEWKQKRRQKIKSGQFRITH